MLHDTPRLRALETSEIGAFLGNLVFAGFREETIFRGFLLPQLYLKLR